ncbi:hypothetical protein D307_gp020 [Bacillus phage Bastille]|uniref:Uncharacterized protein n=1 Tax=Bacillus phage Bastille TaxID=57477 RepID=J9PKR6_9CAUD|nr:hypothetical protein D307_gp020 [Bacillus phage Bastille]AEQ34444.1 hypothetical protein [Bacillus phage Bastille]AZF89144.1 hypothetical protein Goe5_c00360 [Bacillus phage vB_BthM-Goe5]
MLPSRPYIEYRELMRVRNTKDIINGDIHIPALSSGIVICVHNQNRVVVWFTSEWRLEDKLNKKLGCETSFRSGEGSLHGVSVVVQTKNLAVNIHYPNKDKLVNLKVDAGRFANVPLFDGKGLTPHQSQWMINGSWRREWELFEVIDSIEDAFSSWVEKNGTTREISDDEREDMMYPDEWDFVYTEDFMKEYYAKKEVIEIEFAIATGVYNEFTGGMCFND